MRDIKYRWGLGGCVEIYRLSFHNVNDNLKPYNDTVDGDSELSKDTVSEARATTVLGPCPTVHRRWQGVRHSSGASGISELHRLARTTHKPQVKSLATARTCMLARLEQTLAKLTELTGAPKRMHAPFAVLAPSGPREYRAMRSHPLQCSTAALWCVFKGAV